MDLHIGGQFKMLDPVSVVIARILSQGTLIGIQNKLDRSRPDSVKRELDARVVGALNKGEEFPLLLVNMTPNTLCILIILVERRRVAPSDL